MFIGHFAVAFAAKRVAPEVSLGALFFAAQLADLVWPTLVLLAIERFAIEPGATAVTPLDFIDYPWSHSLVALLAWGLALGLIYGLLARARLGAPLLLFALVLSHWILDVASHRPDMPLTPGSEVLFGFGLWNSLPATLAVEGGLFAIGVALYTLGTRAVDGIGRWGFMGLVGFLAVVYLANVFGPVPPNTAAVAWTAQAIWLLVAWGYWIDRHRQPVRRRALRAS